MDGREVDERRERASDDARRLQVVYAIQRLLALLQDEPTVLRESCELLAQYRGYAGVAITYALPEGGEEVVAATGVRPVSDDATELAIRTCEPAVLALADPLVGAVGAVPLRIAEDVAGALTAYLPRGLTFDAKELQLLVGIAEDIGRAVESVRMRVLLAESAARSHSSLGRLETLWRLSTDHSGDVAEQAMAILAEGTRTLGLEFGAVDRIEGERIDFEWICWSERHAEPIIGLALPGTIAELIRRRQTTLAHIDDGDESDPELSGVALAFSLRSVIGTPIAFGNGDYLLVFGSRVPRTRPFAEEDHTYVELLAALFGRLLEQRRQQEELAALVATDPVTGLLNRARFIDVLGQSMVEARARGEGLNLVLVVVDHFRDLRAHLDRDDHDRIIRTFADRLRGIVGNHARVAYLGTEEFALAVNGPPERGEQLARVLGEAVALPVNVEGREVRRSASVGVALFPRDADEAELLLGAADAAVVRAQQEGGGTVRFFSEEIGESLRLKRAMLQGLRYARQREEFELHYQPVLDLADGAVSTVEALLRWHDPQYGLRLPADFIEAAEESESILPIDEWVMREAIHRSRALVCGARRLQLSFNLSGSAVAHPGTLALLARILRDEGADPAYLQLEISERIASREPEAAQRLVEGVRELGMSVAIDDFGTGYASLMLVKQMTIDALKIDRAFVRDLPGSPEDEAIVRATVALGRSLGRRVVALGVERESTAAWLTAEGCSAAQGYWFTPPLPQEEFLSWLSIHE